MNQNQTPTQSPNNSLDPKVIALLSYMLWLPGGIIFFATNKDSYVRYHAMQSILFSVFMLAIYIFFTVFGFMFWFLLPVITVTIWTVLFAAWVLLMIKSYQGERFKLPVLGKLAEKFARQV
jgi:uncharacterized membrane protein